MEMFGVLDLESSDQGYRFAIGIRSANNKRFRLACTVGLRVFVVPEPCLPWRLQPGLSDTRSASCSKTRFRSGWTGCNGTLVRCAAGRTLARAAANRGGGKADHLPSIHRRRSGCAQTPCAEGTRTLVQSTACGVRTANDVEPIDAFTSAFKELDSILQFKATAKLGEFLEFRSS